VCVCVRCDGLGTSGVCVRYNGLETIGVCVRYDRLGTSGVCVRYDGLGTSGVCVYSTMGWELLIFNNNIYKLSDTSLFIEQLPFLVKSLPS